MAHTTLKSLFTAIADAIRGKDGTTEPIVADDFPERISSIQTEDHTIEDILVQGGEMVEYVNNRVTKLRSFAFLGINVATVTLNAVKAIPENAFIGCPLCKLICKRAESLGLRACDTCSALESVDMFGGDFINGESLYGCTSLRILILRNADPNNLTSLGMHGVDDEGNQITALSDTAIGKGNGYIYVPRALVESYKAKYIWAHHASQFRALEDYTVDGTITGDLDESKI